MDMLKNLKNGSNNNGQTRKEYSLTEIVGIMSLINEGVKIKDIALLTNRSEYSLRYKFFEKTALKGKDKPRSVQQYESMEELFAAHGAQYSQEDFNRRIQEFNQTIAAKVEAAV